MILKTIFFVILYFSKISKKIKFQYCSQIQPLLSYLGALDEIIFPLECLNTQLLKIIGKKNIKNEIVCRLILCYPNLIRLVETLHFQIINQDFGNYCSIIIIQIFRVFFLTFFFKNFVIFLTNIYKKTHLHIKNHNEVNCIKVFQLQKQNIFTLVIYTNTKFFEKRFKELLKINALV